MASLALQTLWPHPTVIVLVELIRCLDDAVDAFDILLRNIYLAILYIPPYLIRTAMQDPDEIATTTSESDLAVTRPRAVPSGLLPSQWADLMGNQLQLALEDQADASCETEEDSLQSEAVDHLRSLLATAALAPSCPATAVHTEERNGQRVTLELHSEVSLKFKVTSMVGGEEKGQRIICFPVPSRTLGNSDISVLSAIIKARQTRGHSTAASLYYPAIDRLFLVLMKKCIAQVAFDDWTKVELALDWCSCNDASSLHSDILKKFIAPARTSSEYVRDTLLPAIPNLHACATRNNALDAVLPTIRWIISEWSTRVLGDLPATADALEADLATLEEKWTPCNSNACGILQNAVLSPSFWPTFDVGVPDVRRYRFKLNLKLCARFVQSWSYMELDDLRARFYTFNRSEDLIALRRYEHELAHAKEILQDLDIIEMCDEASAAVFLRRTSHSYQEICALCARRRIPCSRR